MRKSVKLVGGGFVLIVALLVTGVILFHTAFIQDYLSKALGRDVHVGNRISIGWGWPVTTLTVNDVQIGNFKQGTKPELLTADKINIAFDFGRLLHGRLFFPEISFDKPNLLLEKDADGNANWEFGHNAGGATAIGAATPTSRTEVPMIGLLAIREGSFAYKDPTRKTDITINIRNFAGSSKENEKLHMEGKGIYNGQPFELGLIGGSIDALQDASKPYPLEATIKVGDTKVQLKGAMQEPLHMKGLDVTLTVAGKSAADIFDVTGIALPPTPPYEVSGKLDHHDQVWEFNNFTGRMGDSDLNGSLSWDMTNKRPLFTGDFVSKNLNFADLGGLVGAAPGKKDTANKTDTQASADAKENASPYVIPDVPLDISRMAAMDAKVSFTGKKLISTSLPLDDFSLKLDLDDRLLKISPVRFGTAKGDVHANLTVNARQEPVTIDGDFAFSHLKLKPIFASVSKTLDQPNVADGEIGGAAKLSGTGKSLRQMLASANGDIGIGMQGGWLSNLVIALAGLDVAHALGFYVSGDEPVAVRCVIGDFKVDDGLMGVRHFIIDTAASNIDGQGTINLKDEALKLTLNPSSKQPSLTLNSPIYIDGTMKKPAIGVSPTEIGIRGAIAAAVSVVVPVVGLAAFIDPGLGKDSDCGRLIREMGEHSGQGKAAIDVPKNAPIAPPK